MQCFFCFFKKGLFSAPVDPDPLDHAGPPEALNTARHSGRHYAVVHLQNLSDHRKEGQQMAAFEKLNVQ